MLTTRPSHVMSRHALHLPVNQHFRNSPNANVALQLQRKAKPQATTASRSRSRVRAAGLFAGDNAQRVSPSSFLNILMGEPSTEYLRT